MLLTYHHQVSPGDVGHRVNGDMLAFHKVGVKELVLVMGPSSGIQRLWTRESEDAARKYRCESNAVIVDRNIHRRVRKKRIFKYVSEFVLEVIESMSNATW